MIFGGENGDVVRTTNFSMLEDFIYQCTKSIQLLAIILSVLNESDNTFNFVKQ